MAKIPTKFMNNLRTDMLERGLSEGSVNTYLGSLVRLNGGDSFNNFGFLKTDKELVVEFLNQYEKDNTKATYLSAICAGLNSLGISKSHLYKSCYKFYHDMLDEVLGKLDNVDGNKKTDEEETNWVDWSQVMEVHSKLGSMVDKFKGDRSLPSSAAWETLQKYFVLSLFCLQPPRRNKDYQNMFVLLKPLPSGKELDTTKNYLDVPDRRFIFNDFKNRKFVGSQTFDIGDDLMNVIMIWLKFHPDLNIPGNKAPIVPLFVNRNRVPETGKVNYITLLLNRAFGKKVGSSLLRKSYVSSQFGDVFKMEDEVMEKRKEIADKMAHNLDTQRNKYYKREKKFGPEEETAE